MALDIHNDRSTCDFYLHKPSDKFKQKLMVFYNEGQFCNLESEISSAAKTSIFLYKKDKENFSNLLNKTLACLNKENIFGASKNLAEAVLALNIGFRVTGKQISIYEMIAEHTEVSTTMYIGLPFLPIIMSEQNEIFLESWRVGRFSTGAAVLIAHKKEGFTAPPAKTEDGHFSNMSDAFLLRKDKVNYRMIRSASDPSLDEKLRGYYMDMLVYPIAEKFKSDLNSDQLLPGALGASIFDVQKLFQVNELRIDVSFQKFGNRSNVLMSHSSDWLSDDMKVLESTYVKVRDLLLDKPLDHDSLVDKAILLYGNFVNKAQLSERQGRTSESFLLGITAIEIILGGPAACRKRAALIYGAKYKTEYREAEIEMGKLYDSRSRYVHNGKEIIPEKLKLLFNFTEAIMISLLYMRQLCDISEKDFLTKYWYPRLDHVIASTNIGEKVNDKLIAECGLHFSNHRSENLRLV